MNPVIIKCGGCGYIFTKTYGYSLHKCPTKPVKKTQEKKN